MRQLTSILACGAALALVGCGDSHDKVMSDTLDVISDMNDVLDGVKDKSSAEAAAPRLKSLGERMQKIKSRSDKLGQPSAEQQTVLEKKYEERMGKEMMRMFGNALRVGMNPETGPILEAAMADLEPPDFAMGEMGNDAQPMPGMDFPTDDMPEMPEFIEPDGAGPALPGPAPGSGDRD